ncbi:MAG: DUF1161 domain-containing protein [Nevskia sp.]|nr:DUF1161 domain-containing protein [Nevskia sp.]
MKHLQAILSAAALAVGLASAQALATTCDQVQASIDAKIKANGVKDYTLEAVPVAEVKDRKVVGTCEVGTKKIVYTRAAKPATTQTVEQVSTPSVAQK